jgi:hypothetical protein
MKKYAYILSLLIFLVPSYTIANELKQHLSTFVDVYCCYTNNCCWEIDESQITDLGNDKYKIKSTGQIVTRRAYSPDGKYWRCACDEVKKQVDGYHYSEWVKHQGANTRCLFTPRMSF